MIQHFSKEDFDLLQETDRYEAIHLVACGIGTPGWYFWNNFKTYAKGPYPSEEHALAWEAHTRRVNPGWFNDEK